MERHKRTAHSVSVLVSRTPWDVQRNCIFFEVIGEGLDLASNFIWIDGHRG
jgi:hypothetical protein